jgi:CRP-like cAMP-binding protein
MHKQRSPFARKLASFMDLSEPDLSVLAQLHSRRKSFDVGAGMVHQGQPDQQAYVLADGWAFSYRLLPNGGRQVIDFQVPGDFLGLSSVLFRSAGQCVEPVTAVQATLLDPSHLLAVFSANPSLRTAVLWAAARDEAMVVEHLVSIGRRNAVERTAHLLLELGARLSLVGLGSKAGYDCPVSQYLLADALGLSAVHVNRVLRVLREDKLLTFRNGRVVLQDFDGLVALSNFDREYLDHGLK